MNRRGAKSSNAKGWATTLRVRVDQLLGESAAGTGNAGSAGSTARLLWWLLPFTAVVIAAIVTFDPRLYINGDNVNYMFMAERVAAGDFWPSQKYPPLFCYLLVPVQAIFGLALLPQKLLVFSIYLVSLVFWLRIVRRRWDGPIGPVIFWLGATLVPWMEYSNYVMSEVPFLLTLLVSWDAFERFQKEDTASFAGIFRKEAFWTFCFFTLAGFYIRTAGAAVTVGFLIVLLVRKDFRSIGVFTAVLAVGILPWLVQSLTREGGNPYVHQLMMVNSFDPNSDALGWKTFGERILENCQAYFRRILPRILFPFPYMSTYSAPELQKIEQPYGLALLPFVVLVVGWARSLWRRDVLGWVILPPIVVLLIWPSIWSSSRLILPLLPLFALCFWEGLRGLAKITRFLRWGLAVCLLLLSVVNLGALAEERAHYDSEWKNYFAALEWIDREVEADARVCDRKPEFSKFVAKRPTRNFPRDTNTEAIIAFLKDSGTDYVVVSGIPYSDIRLFLVPAVQAHREHFEVVQAFTDDRVDPDVDRPAYVFRFIPEP